MNSAAAWLLLVISAAAGIALRVARPVIAGPTPETPAEQSSNAVIGSRSEATVSTARELVDALGTVPRVATIRLRAGRYVLDATLSVPDGVELIGEGEMRLDADGLAVGFAPGMDTVLVASKRLQGDVVVLGDATRLENVRIEGRALASLGSDAVADGNVVAVFSRRAHDRVRTALIRCEIVNHSNAGIRADGPAGRAIAVATMNSGRHEGAQLAVTIRESIVRNTATSESVFAINFASGGTVTLDLERNRLEGSSGLAGGAGRPDKVRGGQAVLRSRGNLYVAGPRAHRFGWIVLGGSVAPHPEFATTEGGADSSTVRVESQDDRIEGFRTGILAAAGRLVAGLPGAVTGNRAELSLNRLRIRSAGDGAADVSLHGALIVPTPELPARAVTTPEGNVLRARIQDSIGSGRRDNIYSDFSQSDSLPSTPAPPSNRLEFLESRTEFLQSNTGFDPAPDARHFESP